MSLKALFIGGTGIISSACTRLAAARGVELYLLNRGKTSLRPIPDSVHLLQGDIRERGSALNALGSMHFDVVVDWVAFTPEHIENDIALFRGRTGQFIFISSASAYQKPVGNLPITESTPLHNPYWEYSRNKIACEERLIKAYRTEGFPATIVRPSHTYDCTLLPPDGGYTVIDRMRQGKKVWVLGDGTSLWVLTHHADFAKGFLGLMGNMHAIGDAVHITSDEVLTWNQIFNILANAAGVAEPKLVHVPSEVLNSYDPNLGAGLLGDKAHSVIFDNSKVKRLVPDFACTIPFARGAEEIMAWYDADPSRRTVDEKFNTLSDKVIAAQEAAFSK